MEENQLSSVRPKDLRLTLTDNLVIVTIALTLLWSTKEQQILELNSSTPVCPSSFLCLSRASLLECPSFPSVFSLTFLLTFFLFLTPFFYNLKCAFSFYFANSLDFPCFSVAATPLFMQRFNYHSMYISASTALIPVVPHPADLLSLS